MKVYLWPHALANALTSFIQHQGWRCGLRITITTIPYVIIIGVIVNILLNTGVIGRAFTLLLIGLFMFFSALTPDSRPRN